MRLRGKRSCCDPGSVERAANPAAQAGVKDELGPPNGPSERAIRSAGWLRMRVACASALLDAAAARSARSNANIRRARVLAEGSLNWVVPPATALSLVRVRDNRKVIFRLREPRSSGARLSRIPA